MQKLLQTLFVPSPELITIDGVDYMGYSQSVPDMTGFDDTDENRSKIEYVVFFLIPYEETLAFIEELDL